MEGVSAKGNVVRVLLFSVGRDRPGLTHQLAFLCAKNGAVVKSSRVEVADGDLYCMRTIVTVKPRNVHALIRDFSSVKGIKTQAWKAEPQSKGKQVSKPSTRFILSIVTMDTVGLLRDFTALVGSKGMNVVDMEATTEQAPMTGTELFRMTVKAEAPGEWTQKSLEDYFFNLAQHAWEIDVELGWGDDFGPEIGFGLAA